MLLAPKPGTASIQVLDAECTLLPGMVCLRQVTGVIQLGLAELALLFFTRDRSNCKLPRRHLSHKQRARTWFKNQAASHQHRAYPVDSSFTLSSNRCSSIPVRITSIAVRALIAILCIACQTAFGQSLSAARSLEISGDYAGALLAYKSVLVSEEPSGADKRYAKIKLPVLEEASRRGGGADLTLYLNALSDRARYNHTQALANLTQLLNDHPNSRLRDDSSYLIGYILMMDQFDFSNAKKAMAALQSDFPDSRYFDSALYSQAIAEEQLGNTKVAFELFSNLRDRHTRLSINLFGVVWPDNTVISRYWFDRSNSRLEFIQKAERQAVRVVRRVPINHPEFSWRLNVSSNGRQYTLLLKPSPILQDTQMAGVTADRMRNTRIETLAGVVEGESDSWVRITLKGSTLLGTISIDRQRQPLIAAATGGSLGYYNRLLRSDINGRPSSQHTDAPMPPPKENAISNFLRSIQLNKNKINRRKNEVTHIARLGVVIDSQYNDYHGGNGFQEALSILNNTDGIFREEFGIALHIESVTVIPDRKSDPLNIGRTTMEKMMRNFRQYRLTTSGLGADIGLATLFSGNKNNDLPLGHAWIGTACRNDGYDVSVVTPFSEADILSTHEIAHTMGASHDFDTACNESQHLMTRYLSNHTRQTFSSCSRQAVANLLATTSCHTRAANTGLNHSGL